MAMRSLPFLLIAGFVLVLMAGEADAEKEPLWSYETGDDIESVAISADGEYIAASSDDEVYLFNKNSSIPLWNYTAYDDIRAIAISADGEYIVAGFDDGKVYLFSKDNGTPLWSYATGRVYELALSADGEYIVAGSDDDKVYLFYNNMSQNGGDGNSEENSNEENELLLSSVSMISSIAAIGIIALRRRY